MPVTGPSTTQTPYIVGLAPNITFASILSAGDQVGTKPNGQPFVFVGVPDGLGAFDNGDGTFTVLVNHEVFAPVTAGGVGQSTIREHGAAGSFVTQLLIDKTTLEVIDAFDLANQSYRDVDGDGVYTLEPIQFSRLCSADLPPISAFFDAGIDGLEGTDDDVGTMDRIFLNGEEFGAEGRGFGWVVTGDEARTVWELPGLGKFSWENSVANPNTGAKTVVVGTDDSTPGQVYVYVGDKQATGTTVEKAGLTDGVLYGIKAVGIGNTLTGNAENQLTAAATPMSGTFTSVALGNVATMTGAQLETASDAAGVTEWWRPEDSAWDTVDPNRLYFVTTSSFTTPSRLWALDFLDAADPTLGGEFTMLLDGTEGQKMMDNITVDSEGLVHIQEDVGSNAFLGRVLVYNPATDTLNVEAQFDPDRFLPPVESPFTIDEESSGIIEVTSILGDADTKAFLLDAQAHYLFPGPLQNEVVEGGQLMVMYVDDYNPGLDGDRFDNLLIGGIANEEFTAGAGNDTIMGSSGNDTIRGGRGNDMIQGGNGADLLIGAAGNDMFYYRDASEGGDTIKRFVQGEDKIVVSAFGFGGGLVEGQAITSEQIAFGQTPDGPGGQFIYDDATGIIRWDADGVNGTAQVIVIATLINTPPFVAADILVVA